ncbi:5-hydroxytryptamine receptor 1 [Eufriesea mexicana]|uniref:5-hydroxytryptamine receptor 1 n=1 Tax=Eufriesea mexicana TaxID=516756 RepID=A0A310SNI2_9HYME|nr:5-hydroxytryptamine receptor 1 [Eufriesea mexicana]
MLASLAVSDLCVALLVISMELLYEISGNWSFGKIMCDLWVSFDVLSCTASILYPCMISVDRFCEITKPLKYGVKGTPRRMVIYVILGWLAATCISLPPLMIMRNERTTETGATMCSLPELLLLELHHVGTLLHTTLRYDSGETSLSSRGHRYCRYEDINLNVWDVQTFGTSDQWTWTIALYRIALLPQQVTAEHSIASNTTKRYQLVLLIAGWPRREPPPQHTTSVYSRALHSIGNRAHTAYVGTVMDRTSYNTERSRAQQIITASDNTAPNSTAIKAKHSSFLKSTGRIRLPMLRTAVYRMVMPSQKGAE